MSLQTCHLKPNTTNVPKPQMSITKHSNGILSALKSQTMTSKVKEPCQLFPKMYFGVCLFVVPRVSVVTLKSWSPSKGTKSIISFKFRIQFNKKFKILLLLHFLLLNMKIYFCPNCIALPSSSSV